MEAISSSVNKGAIKVAPKIGGLRRSRPTVPNVKKAVSNPTHDPPPRSASAARLPEQAEVNVDGSTKTRLDPSLNASKSDRNVHFAEPTFTEPSSDQQGLLCQEVVGDDERFVRHQDPAADTSESHNLPVPTRSKSLVPVSANALRNSAGVTVDQVATVHETPELAKRDEQAHNGAETNGDTAAREVEERKPRSRRKRERTPDDAEERVIDTTNLKMADLCRDLRTGRKSTKFADFERITAKRRYQKRRGYGQSSIDTNSGEVAVTSDAADAAENDDDDDESKHKTLSIVDAAQNNGHPSASRVPTGAPQIRVVNGKMVIDTESLQVDRTMRDAANNNQIIEYVDENPLEKVVNSRSYAKYQSGPRWDNDSTDLFYEGLSQWGTDFDMISRMFPNRIRSQIKSKYTREMKQNRLRVTAALEHKKPVDLEAYSIICGRTFRPIEELEANLDEVKTKFEAERQEALKAAELRQADSNELDMPMPASIPGNARRSRKRRDDDGVELVGTVEEVEAQERAEAAAAAAT